MGLPITVPNGDYCWGPAGDGGQEAICDAFDNEGGYPICRFGFIGCFAKYDSKGMPKPQACKDLMEVKE